MLMATPQKLPKEIGNLVNLTYLNVENNLLTELPKEIFNLVNLTGLYLAYNQLTELPKEIGNLVNLTHLDIRSEEEEYPQTRIKAMIAKLPKEIGNLVNLEYLNIKNLDINKLPDEIINLVNLTTLKVFYISVAKWEQWEARSAGDLEYIMDEYDDDFGENLFAIYGGDLSKEQQAWVQGLDGIDYLNGDGSRQFW